MLTASYAVTLILKVEYLKHSFISFSLYLRFLRIIIYISSTDCYVGPLFLLMQHITNMLCLNACIIIFNSKGQITKHFGEINIIQLEENNLLPLKKIQSKLSCGKNLAQKFSYIHFFCMQCQFFKGSWKKNCYSNCFSLIGQRYSPHFALLFPLGSV